MKCLRLHLDWFCTVRESLFDVLVIGVDPVPSLVLLRCYHLVTHVSCVLALVDAVHEGGLLTLFELAGGHHLSDY